MLKFLSKVKIEFNALDPRIASCMEFLAQCNARTAKESNPACQILVKRRTDEHPPQIAVTFVNGVEEVFDATATPAQTIRTMILEKGQYLETEQMFREAGEKWPVVIPEEELHRHAPGTKANAASGIAVRDDCKLRFLELKAKRTHRSIVFKIEEKQKQVIVEKLGDPAQSYEDFASSLPADECRYAVYDFDFVTAENCPKSRIFFIAWSPDISRVRSKMIYASSKDRFKRELDGIQVELQATDPTEISLDVIRSRAS